MSPFLTYLNTIRSTTINFIIGNRAGDLDSCISSMTYSYLLSTLSPPVTHIVTHIPILPFPLTSLRLKPDTLQMLSELSIPPSSLLGVDEMLHFVSSNPNLNYTLTLVDHNVPDLPPSHPATALLTSSISNILDHHVDSGTPVQ
ncbi:hypothetical protein TrRE_jg773, partial [Triparma retinervis]